MVSYTYGVHVFSDQDLQTFWDQYVVMKWADVLLLTDPNSASYDPRFSAALKIVQGNRLFGFDPSWNPRRAYYDQRSCIFNGPLSDADAARISK